MIFNLIKPVTRCCSCILQKSRRYSLEMSTTNILSEYFGISQTKANSLVKKYKLGPNNNKDDNLVDVLKCLQELGFDKEDILNCPSVLKVHPITIEQRYLFFKESGFNKIVPVMISRCRSLYNRTVLELKLRNMLPKELRVADNYLQFLKPLPEHFDVSDLNDDSNELIKVHLSVMQRYLVWRLETNDEEIQRLFRIYKMIRNKSLAYLCENIEIAEYLGFERNKLLKYGYLLHNYPKYTKIALEEFPNIAGGDLKKAMRIYPKLTMVAPKNYIKIYGILKEHNIPDETIRNSMNIFHLSPETVRLRLQEIESVPELRTLLTNPKVLKLIIHHNRARSRLSFLQQLELRCAGVVVLGSAPSEFDAHVQEGKDVHSLADLLTFLKALFNNKSFDFKRWKLHPFFQNIPFLQMEETYEHLLSKKFHPKSIYKVMHIVLYPKESIDAAVSKMKEHSMVRSAHLNQTQRLNLILYHIEKEHHFTGNGVWSKNKNSS